MTRTKHNLALFDFHTASQPIFLRIFIPRIQHVEFFRRRFFEVLHAANDLDRAGATGTIEAAGLHFNAGFLAGIQQQFAWRHVGGDICWQDSYFRHDYVLRSLASIPDAIALGTGKVNGTFSLAQVSWLLARPMLRPRESASSA